MGTSEIIKEIVFKNGSKIVAIESKEVIRGKGFYIDLSEYEDELHKKE